MKKSLLIAICLCLPVVHSEAQQLRKNYVTWPQSPLLHDYVKAWTKGEPLTTTWDSDGVRTEWEDEEFFISRVKLKPYKTKTKQKSDAKKLHKWQKMTNFASHYEESALPALYK